jgi:hypothetical protein
MECSAEVHWGSWIKARARHVGFRNFGTLASAIGCTPESVSRWFALEDSPERCRSQFDAALCRVLRTDAFTLFTNFRNIAPTAAPVLDPSPAAGGANCVQHTPVAA